MNWLRNIRDGLAAAFAGLRRDGEGPPLAAAPRSTAEVTTGTKAVPEELSDRDWAVLAASFHF